MHLALGELTADGPKRLAGATGRPGGQAGEPGRGGGEEGGTHLQGLAACAAGALAHRLLPALVAGQAVDLVVHAVAGGVVAVLKQSPAGG